MKVARSRERDKARTRERDDDSSRGREVGELSLGSCQRSGRTPVHAPHRAQKDKGTKQLAAELSGNSVIARTRCLRGVWGVTYGGVVARTRSRDQACSRELMIATSRRRDESWSRHREIATADRSRGRDLSFTRGRVVAMSRPRADDGGVDATFFQTQVGILAAMERRLPWPCFPLAERRSVWHSHVNAFSRERELSVEVSPR